MTGEEVRGTRVAPSGPRGLLALLSWALAAVAAVANLACLSFAGFFGPLLALPVSLGAFAGVGLVLTLRRPKHAVGWLFLTAGVLFSVTFLSSGYAWTALNGAPGSLPAGELMAWVNSWIWTLALGSSLIAVFLFPTGRPPSKRWWPVLVLWWVGFAIVVLTSAFAPDPISLPTKDLGEVPRSIENPVGVRGALGDALLTLAPFGEVSAPAMFLVVIASVVARFRSARGIERQQLKWFTYAAAFSIGLLIVAFTAPRGPAADIAWATGVVSFGGMPVAAGIAIMRYRLYDIDALINRTLVYGALTAALGGAYVGSVLLLQAVLRPFTAENEIAVAISTLAVVALFQPLRRRIQDWVDRRFYRSRYDAQRTLDAFSSRLRDEIDLAELERELVAVVAETVRPSHAGLWLRGAAR